MKRARYISNGTLTYTIEGPQGPQGPKGEVGPQGPAGPQGPKGDAAPAEIVREEIDKAIAEGSISAYDDTKLINAIFENQQITFNLSELSYNQYWLTALPQGDHASGSARSFVIDVTQYTGSNLYMKFNVMATGGSVLKYAYVIADASDNILLKDGEPDYIAKSIDTTVVIPDNAKTLYIGTDSTNMSSAIIEVEEKINKVDSIQLNFDTLKNSVDITKITSSLQNDCVDGYMKNDAYNCNDYSTSYVEDFLAATTYRKDQPKPLELHVDNATSFILSDNPKYNNSKTYTSTDGTVSIYNLLPKRYYCKAMNESKVLQEYAINITGERRMIKCDSIYNVRDIGGLVGIDGRRIRYGLLFRGSELDTNGASNLTTEEIAMMRDLGIKAEIDLRYDGTDGTTDENILGRCVLGDDIEYFHINGYPFGSFDKGNAVFVTLVNKIIEFLGNGKPVYIHCQGGADRTGFMCAALEGILGVNENSLAKDYELSSFSTYGVRKRSDASGNYHYKTRIERVKSENGNTLSEQWFNHFSSNGLTEENVKKLRNLMLE